MKEAVSPHSSMDQAQHVLAILYSGSRSFRACSYSYKATLRGSHLPRPPHDCHDVPNVPHLVLALVHAHVVLHVHVLGHVLAHTHALVHVLVHVPNVRHMVLELEGGEVAARGETELRPPDWAACLRMHCLSGQLHTANCLHWSTAHCKLLALENWTVQASGSRVTQAHVSLACTAKNLYSKFSIYFLLPKQARIMCGIFCPVLALSWTLSVAKVI